MVGTNLKHTKWTRIDHPSQLELDDNKIHPIEEYNLIADIIVRRGTRSIDTLKDYEEISFVLGSDLKKGENKIFGNDLTTTYLDVSANNINDNDINRSCLGVDSIDIDYSNWFYPQVSIKFTDVRAQALMMPQEELYFESLLEDGKLSETIKNTEQAQALFNSLFMFPYPEFELRVKGFYGHAVSFTLTVNEFASSFNSDTGNFDITVSFIGHLYGFLTDIPMNYILIAPYIKKSDSGENYWVQSNFMFSDGSGKKIPTFVELARKILNVNDNLYKLPRDNKNLIEYKTIQNKNTLLNEVLFKVSNLINYLNYENTDPSYIETSINVLLNEIENYKTRYSQDLGEEILKHENTLKSYISNNINNKKDYIKILEEIREIIDNKINGYEDISRGLESNLTIEVKERVENVLGFNPSIENIFNIIFAHIDTFIYYFNAYIKDIEQQRNKDKWGLNEDNSDIPKNIKSVPPFPLITKYTDYYNNNEKYKKKEVIYPSHHENGKINSQNMPELKMVDDMLKNTTSAINGLKSLFNFLDNTENNFLPSMILDTITGVNPYEFYRDDNISDVQNNVIGLTNSSMFVLVLRSILYTWLNEKKLDTNTLVTMGEIEAYNFFNIYKDNSNIIDCTINETSSKEISINKINEWHKNFINVNKDNKDYNNFLVKKGEELFCNGVASSGNELKWHDIPVNFTSRQDIKRVIENEGEKSNGMYYDIFLSKDKENKYEFCILGGDDVPRKYINIFETVENDDNIILTNKGSFYKHWHDGVFNNIIEAKNEEILINTLISINVKRDDVCHIPDKKYNENEDYKGYKYKYGGYFNRELHGGWPDYVSNYNDLYYMNFFGDRDIEKLYYNENNNINLDNQTINKRKAFLYLFDKCYSSEKDRLKFIEKFLDNENAIKRISKITLLYFGGILWMNEQDGFEILGNDDVKKNIENILQELHNRLNKNEVYKLKEVFNDWVNNDFKNYYLDLELKGENGKKLTYDNYEKMLDELTYYYDDKNDKRSFWDENTHIVPDEIVKKYSNTVYDVLGEINRKNYEYIYLTNLYLNPNVSKPLTQDLLSDIYIYRPHKFYENNLHDDGNSKKVNKENIETILKSFNNKLIELKSEKIRLETENQPKSDINDEIKLSLYLTLKNIYDRWKIKIVDNKDTWLLSSKNNDFNNFVFIDTKYNKVGQDIIVNCDKLLERINNVLNNPNSNISLYDFMYDIASSCNMQFMTLPVKNFFDDVSNNMKDIFTPQFSLLGSLTSKNNGSTHVCVYTDIPSYNLNIGNGIGDYEYTSDGCDLADTLNFNISEGGEGNVVDNNVIPCFDVHFGRQNQSIFKNIRINMDNPQVTEYSIAQQLTVANRYGNGTVNQGYFKGQDLYKIYSNNSYTCSVDMMGCVNMMPLMHFRLNDLPLFKGIYRIISVKHHIEAGNMITTFTGVRENMNAMPFNKSAIYISAFKDKLNTMDAYIENVFKKDEYDSQYMLDEYKTESLNNKSNEKYNTYADVCALKRKYNNINYPLIFFGKNFSHAPEKSVVNAWEGLRSEMKDTIIKIARIIEENNLPYGIMITSGFRGETIPENNSYPVKGSYHNRGLAVDIHGIDLGKTNTGSFSEQDFPYYSHNRMVELDETKCDKKYSPHLFDLIANTLYKNGEISELFWENKENVNNPYLVTNTVHVAIQDNNIADSKYIKRAISQGIQNKNYTAYTSYDDLSELYLNTCAKLYKNDKNNLINSNGNFQTSTNKETFEKNYLT